MSLEFDPGVLVRGAAGSPDRTLRRKLIVSVVGALAVAGVLSLVLARRPGQFIAALHSAPIAFLAVAALLQIVALLARSEAWNVCVHAAGGSVSRRTVFRAAGFGYLASVINGSVGMAARIASLRRAAPQSSPRVPALIAAEVPIITVEVALAAIFSFTLIAPLGVPWWVPAIAVVAMACVVLGLRRFSEGHRAGLWAGLAVVRKSGRGRVIVFTLIAVCAQVARNWLMLHAIGENVSIFDSMALLIAMFTVGQLPIGPSIGPAAAVLILGAHGVASSAAAGVLVAATGVIGSLCYATWALTDGLVAGRSGAREEAVAAPIALVAVLTPPSASLS